MFAKRDGAKKHSRKKRSKERRRSLPFLAEGKAPTVLRKGPPQFLDPPVREGWLWKKSPHKLAFLKSSYQKRYYSLFPKHLQYGKDRTPDKLKGVINLELVNSIRQKTSTSFNLVVGDQSVSRVFCLRAKSAEDCTEWIRQLVSCWEAVRKTTTRRPLPARFWKMTSLTTSLRKTLKARSPHLKMQYSRSRWRAWGHAGTGQELTDEVSSPGAGSHPHSPWTWAGWRALPWRTMAPISVECALAHYGALGTVFSARPRHMNRVRYRMHAVERHGRFAQQLQQLIQDMPNLDHPYLPRQLLCGDSTDALWALYTPPVSSHHSLRSNLQRHGRFPCSVVVLLVAQLTAAIAYLHEHFNIECPALSTDHVFLDGKGNPVIMDELLLLAPSLRPKSRSHAAYIPPELRPSAHSRVGSRTRQSMAEEADDGFDDSDSDSDDDDSEAWQPTEKEEEHEWIDDQVEDRPVRDWWRLGILAFELLVGHPPQVGGDSNFDPAELEFPVDVSCDVINFVRALLHPEPTLRLGASGDWRQVMGHLALRSFHCHYTWHVLNQGTDRCVSLQPEWLKTHVVAKERGTGLSVTRSWCLSTSTSPVPFLPPVRPIPSGLLPFQSPSSSTRRSITVPIRRMPSNPLNQALTDLEAIEPLRHSLLSPKTGRLRSPRPGMQTRRVFSWLEEHSKLVKACDKAATMAREDQEHAEAGATANLLVHVQSATDLPELVYVPERKVTSTRSIDFERPMINLPPAAYVRVTVSNTANVLETHVSRNLNPTWEETLSFQVPVELVNVTTVSLELLHDVGLPNTKGVRVSQRAPLRRQSGSSMLTAKHSPVAPVRSLQSPDIEDRPKRKLSMLGSLPEGNSPNVARRNSVASNCSEDDPTNDCGDVGCASIALRTVVEAPAGTLDVSHAILQRNSGQFVPRVQLDVRYTWTGLQSRLADEERIDYTPASLGNDTQLPSTHPLLDPTSPSSGFCSHPDSMPHSLSKTVELLPNPRRSRSFVSDLPPTKSPQRAQTGDGDMIAEACPSTELDTATQLHSTDADGLESVNMSGWPPPPPPLPSCAPPLPASSSSTYFVPLPLSHPLSPPRAPTRRQKHFVQCVMPLTFAFFPSQLSLVHVPMGDEIEERTCPKAVAVAAAAASARSAIAAAADAARSVSASEGAAAGLSTSSSNTLVNTAASVTTVAVQAAKAAAAVAFAATNDSATTAAAAAASAAASLANAAAVIAATVASNTVHTQRGQLEPQEPRVLLTCLPDQLGCGIAQCKDCTKAPATALGTTKRRRSRYASSVPDVQMGEGECEALDMSYITPCLIAMGNPVKLISRPQSTAHDSLRTVRASLTAHHGNGWKMYNLCANSDCTYKRPQEGLSSVQVSCYPFSEHDCPSFALIMAFCRDVHAFVSASDDHVVCVHSKHGRGRVGLLFCCYLMLEGSCVDANDALMFFDKQRTRGGILRASQRAYVHAFAKFLHSNGALIDRSGVRALPMTLRSKQSPLMLTHVRMTPTPNFLPLHGGCHPYFKCFGPYPHRDVLCKNQVDMGASVQAAYTEIVLSRNECVLYGDVQFILYHHNAHSVDPCMLVVWLNSNYVDSQYACFTREQCDGPDGSTLSDEAFAPNFKLELFFVAV